MDPRRGRHGHGRHLRLCAGALGDIVFVEVPEAGRALDQGRRGGGGRIGQGRVATSMRRSAARSIEGNPALADDPALVNRDPEGEGWFFKLTPRRHRPSSTA